MPLLLNASPLPSGISGPCFPCSASVGHTEVPFQGRRGQSRIRTHPHTPTRGREVYGAPPRDVHEEMSRIGCEIRFLIAGSGVLGEPGVGGIPGDATALEFVDFPDVNEPLVNPLMRECGSGTQRFGPQLQAQADRFAEDLVYGFTGCNLGSLGHGLLHLREGWVAGQELHGCGSVPTLLTVRLARVAHRRRQVRQAVG